MKINKKRNWGWNLKKKKKEKEKETCFKLFFKRRIKLERKWKWNLTEFWKQQKRRFTNKTAHIIVLIIINWTGVIKLFYRMLRRMVKFFYFIFVIMHDFVQMSRLLSNVWASYAQTVKECSICLAQFISFNTCARHDLYGLCYCWFHKFVILNFHNPIL